MTVTGATVEDKKYDGTVTANVTGVTLDGILSEDSVSYQAQGTFTDAQPGTEKTVEITVALTGNDKGNFTLTSGPFVAKASIYRVVSDTPAKEPELSKKEQEQVEKLEATKPKEQEPEATKNTVKLTWEKIKNADGYVIYRYDPASGKYVLIKKTEKTSFTDKNLKTATGYQYKIKAYKTKERMYQYRVRSYIRYNKTSIKSKATPVLRLQR